MPTSAPDVSIQLDAVTCGYRSTTVVRDVSLRVGSGELVCILGANGVGKTTLLRAILGLLDVTSGVIALGGEPIQHKPPHVIARMGVGFVPEGRGLVADLSVRDNLVLGTTRWNRRVRSAAVNAALDDVYDHFPVLGQRARQRAGWLSGGEQQMLAIGRALVSRPTVLVLDEPTLGLAPLIVRQVFDDLARIRARGIAVLVAEQNASAALRLATSAYVMKSGRIVSHGTAHEIQSSGALRAAYLGEGA